jgi:hypothetical protein
MIPEPPRQQVNVTRMMIYSLIPILSIYAGWRIQKFWLLLIINVALGFGISILFLVMFGNQLLGIIPQIIISLLIVWHYARRYNEKIAASSTTPQ